MKRRELLRSTFLSTLPLASWIGLSRFSFFQTSYVARFRVALNGKTPNEFFAIQSQFEDNQKIDELSDEYRRKGLILRHRDFVSSDSELRFTYYFKDRQAFESWENKLYSQGIVRPEGRPYIIEREVGYRPISIAV